MRWNGTFDRRTHFSVAANSFRIHIGLTMVKRRSCTLSPLQQDATRTDVPSRRTSISQASAHCRVRVNNDTHYINDPIVRVLYIQCDSSSCISRAPAAHSICHRMHKEQEEQIITPMRGRQ